MSAAARSPLLHPAARFAKRHNVLAVRVQMMVFRVTAANCSREMTSSPNVHLEVNRALKTCFRNKRWVLSTARALGALLLDAGSVAFAAPCNAAISLTGYPLVAALSMKRPARTPRSSLHAVGCLRTRARALWRWTVFLLLSPRSTGTRSASSSQAAVRLPLAPREGPRGHQERHCTPAGCFGARVWVWWRRSSSRLPYPRSNNGQWL